MSGQQLTFDLELGEQLRDAGKDRVAQSNADLRRLLLERAERLARRDGEVTTDQLREYAERLGLQPTHPAFWGSLMRGARWQCAGYRRSKVASNRAREIRVWKLAEPTDRAPRTAEVTDPVLPREPSGVCFTDRPWM